VLEQGEIPMALVVDDQRAVVGNQLTGETQGVQTDKEHKAPVTQPVTTKARPDSPFGARGNDLFLGKRGGLRVREQGGIPPFRSLVMPRLKVQAPQNLGWNGLRH